jgi:transcriptional regulator with XRE-family HTH domain
MNLKKNLGDRIRHYREIKGVSQLELARAVKVDKGTVWRWEDGRSWPNYSKLEAMCASLDIRIEQLFENLTGPAPKVSPTTLQAIEILAKVLQDPLHRKAIARDIETFSKDLK